MKNENNKNATGEKKEKLKHTFSPDCPACAAEEAEQESPEYKAAAERLLASGEAKAMVELNNVVNKAISAFNERFPKSKANVLFIGSFRNEDADAIQNAPISATFRGSKKVLRSLLEVADDKINPNPLNGLFEMLGDVLRETQERRSGSEEPRAFNFNKRGEA